MRFYVPWPKSAADCFGPAARVTQHTLRHTPHLQPLSHKNVLMNSQFTPHANTCICRNARRDCTFQLCVCVRVRAYYLKTVWAQSLERNWNVCFSPFCFSVSSKAVSSQPGSHDSYTLQPPTGEKRLERLINKWGSEMRKEHLKCIRYGEATDAQISWTRWHFYAASVITYKIIWVWLSYISLKSRQKQRAAFKERLKKILMQWEQIPDTILLRKPMAHTVCQRHNTPDMTVVQNNLVFSLVVCECQNWNDKNSNYFMKQLNF